MTTTTAPAAYTVTAPWGELVDVEVSLARAEELVVKYPGARIFRENGDDFAAAEEVTDLAAERRRPRPVGDGVEFAATHRATEVRTDPRIPTAAELAAHRVPVTTGLLDRASDRIDHLEATAERLADRVRVESLARQAAEKRLAELDTALERMIGQWRTASDAAEAYRSERDAARATLDRIARLVDPEG